MVEKKIFLYLVHYFLGLSDFVEFELTLSYDSFLLVSLSPELRNSFNSSLRLLDQDISSLGYTLKKEILSSQKKSFDLIKYKFILLRND